MRIKLNFNSLMEQIDDYFSSTQTEENETDVIGICFGLELMQSYLRQIAERTIILDDEELIGLLVDMGVLRVKEE